MASESRVRQRSRSKNADSDLDHAPPPIPPNIHSIAKFTIGNSPNRDPKLPPGIAIRLGNTPESRTGTPQAHPPTLSLDAVLTPGSKPSSLRNRSRSRSRSRGRSDSHNGPSPSRATHGPNAHAKDKTTFSDDLAEESRVAWQNAKILVLIFICVVLSLFALYSCFPDMPPEEREKLKFPRSMSQLRDLSHVVLKYKDEHFWLVLAFYSMCYISLGSFAIPGSIFLSILAGPLFGLWWGLIIVSTVATTASSICYMLSKTLGGVIVKRKFPGLIRTFEEKLAAHRDHLFYYMLFLRISPILPNWFISLSSPLLNIPLKTFAGATFLGLMPGNYIHISTGLTLNTITSDGPMVNYKAIASLAGIACLALIPVLLKSRFETLEQQIVHPPHHASSDAHSETQPLANPEEDRLLSSQSDIDSNM